MESSWVPVACVHIRGVSAIQGLNKRGSIVYQNVYYNHHIHAHTHMFMHHMHKYIHTHKHIHTLTP